MVRQAVRKAEQKLNAQCQGEVAELSDKQEEFQQKQEEYNKQVAAGLLWSPLPLLCPTPRLPSLTSELMLQHTVTHCVTL